MAAGAEVLGDVVGATVEGGGDVSSNELGVVSVVLCQFLQVANSVPCGIILYRILLLA